ncbi:hypothetical protein VOLCADRAFT_88562 [Volvox carteri f. nagariensis]|uniref:Uncharacterized protein n=1 Tax=Volvox carteri f. nagariensis TaxID=3068 RepID=D8TPB9_VOLCA|nr:uncharacterized protein VOLCADRAFT_88562 [Volvox carteri f. nagariensis]EFJ50594.1 hypothetical protein VOLCADRAFT_88562 [Volvox carteri f. nagariensis]|eukprot:XP_002948187.1 hypothetical protein VOLCADRAFT_88562 [Volvox carteri f. nagariensis]
MGGLAGGAWLGIGLGCGFVLGVTAYVFVTCLIRRRKNVAPQPQARLAAQRASVGGFTSLAHVRDTPSANNLTAAMLPAKPPHGEEVFYSPLQNSMAKPSNVRNSATTGVLPDPAIYGGHGSALMQVIAPASSMQPATLAMPPATPVDKATTQAVPFQSTRDTADQGLLQPKQQHQRMYSVADAYGAEDLDDEWAVVLGDLDGLLAKKGQPGLASPERAVAVRRLIAVTGSQGMQFALEAALQDVMRYRSRK